MSQHEQWEVVSYLKLRQLVGALGILLPASCLAFGLLYELEPSISDYYATPMRNVFVGILWAIGFFLLTYRGHERKDDVAGDLCFVCALGVALCPNSSDIRWVRGLHFLFAMVLFLTFAYYCLKLFTKGKGEPTPQKLRRNRVYRACGWIIILSIILIGVYMVFLQRTWLACLKPVFVLESTALCAFGFSWYVKGETLWQDAVPAGPAP